MMSTRTRNTYTTALAAFGSNEFTERQYDELFGTADHVTLRTLRNNELVHLIVHTTRYFYTVAELVEALNDCSGADCYCGSWFYQIDEQGRVYQDIEHVTYQLVEGA